MVPPAMPEYIDNYIDREYANIYTYICICRYVRNMWIDTHNKLKIIEVENIDYISLLIIHVHKSHTHIGLQYNMINSLIFVY